MSIGGHGRWILILIFYDDVVLESEDIVVPHPSMWYRHFVLTPLNEIAADWQHPVLEESVARLQTRLEHHPLEIDVALPAEVSTADLEAALPRDHRLRLRPASVQQPLAEESFARFVECSDPQRAQPLLETERIVRVPVNRTGDNRLEAWQQAIRDFYSAAAG